MHLKKLLIVVCLLPAPAARAQIDKRAIKYYNKAQYYKAKRQEAKAIKYMQKALEEQKNYDLAFSALGEWYFEQHDYELAGETFATAAQRCKDGYKRYARFAAKSYLLAQKADTALKWSRAMPNSQAEESKSIRERALFIKKAVAAADTNRVESLGVRINGPYAEMYPSLSSDRQTLYFTRRLNGIDEDFYFAKPDSCGGWFTAKNMGKPTNTPNQEAAQIISADDHYLFFMRCENRSENGWAQGGCDIYMAYRVAVDSPWSAGESFGATINTPGYEGMPSLAPDIRELYFVSDRPGGYGGLDIWSSRFEFGLWQAPKNLGPGINTPGNETAPFICADNKTLYFASDGHMGMGGSDLFVVRKNTDSTWGATTNMGFPINSTFDETSIFITPNGVDALLASNRNNSAGNFDIYQTTIPNALKPEQTVFVKCFIYDSLTKYPANYGSIVLSDPETGADLFSYHGNRGDGSVLMSLPLNKSYNYIVRAFSYQEVVGTFSFDRYSDSAFIINFPLLPQGYVKPTRDTSVLTLYYPINIVNITDSQHTALIQTMAAWIGKPDVTIFVNSYTDNSGTPIINEQKSSLRANDVKNLLIKAGHDPNAISATGYGEANPVAPNDGPENQDRNRRIEIVIRE